MTRREEIIQNALGLPSEDRAYIADAIEQSLSGGGFASEEIAAVWAMEIERRIAAYDRGETQAVDVDTALDNMRRKLEEYRARKVNT